MNQDKPSNKVGKKLLLVEDNHGVREGIQGVFKPYEDVLTLCMAVNADEAMKYAFTESRELRTFHAVILDLMMPYGSEDTRVELGGQDDVEDLESGYQFLKYLRNKEQSGKSIWVTVITGRNRPDILNRLSKELKGRGRIMIKPFNDFILEHDICLALGIESQVPGYVLPSNYKPIGNGGE